MIIKIFLVMYLSLKPESFKNKTASEKIFFVDIANCGWKLIGRMFGAR